MIGALLSLFLGKIIIFWGTIINFWGHHPYWGQGFIGGKFITLWGDFQLGARLLTFGGILLTFGGVIIINIFLNQRAFQIISSLKCTMHNALSNEN